MAQYKNIRMLYLLIITTIFLTELFYVKADLFQTILMIFWALP